MLPLVMFTIVSETVYPHTKKIDYFYEVHGIQIEDPYIWLENLEDPEVKSWINSQNRLTVSTLKNFHGFRKLYREIERSWRKEYISLPIKRGNFYFFYRDDGKKNHSVYCMSSGRVWDPKRARILIDPNKFDREGYISLDFVVPSLEGNFIALGKSYGGSESSTLYIMDVKNRRMLSDSIPNAKWTSIAWLKDGSGFFYTRNTDSVKFRPYVYFHKIGQAYTYDNYIFGEDLPDTWTPSIAIDRTGRYLILYVEKGWAENDVYLKDLAEDSDFIPIAKDRPGNFEVKVYGDYLYILTNWGAPNYRILKIPINYPNLDNAEEIVPESSWIIEGFSIAGKRIVLNVSDSTFTRLIVKKLDGSFDHEIRLPLKGTAYFTTEDEDSPVIYISFSSFLYPPTIFCYNLETHEMKKIWQQKVKFDPQDYEQKFVKYVSRDGTEIPMYIIHRKGLKLDGNNPTILTGYGGFNVSMRPRFTGEDLFVKRGFVLAIPCLRGGGEFGEKWHKMGMRENKQNVFDDFIAAAEYLIKNGYTNPDKLVISGGSNGGLLVGAVMAQRPELFKAVYCSVPLLDMVRYHKFGVAHIWIPEYGNPDLAEDFKFLYEYSPYHRIDRNKGEVLPSVFFHTAEFDGRVHPMHAMKMAAKMQSEFKTKGPVLLYVEPKAGHGAGKPRKQGIESSTLRASYIFWQLGINP